ncbi:MAG: ATP-grasp domain-containing protein [Tannerellaceae bacterium]
MNMNILITSAGKRVTLVTLFKKELKAIFPSGKVFTTDMNPNMAPAGIVSDNCFKVCRVTDPEYIDLLISICLENEVKLIVPTIDTELLVLSKVKDRFAQYGISIMVSDYKFISTCRDKRNTNAFFEKCQIRVPNPIDKNKPTYPMFAKPYDGSLSKDLFYIKTPDDLTAEILNHPKLIFMEYIDKSIYKEFTVDLYYGSDHKLKSVVPRERVEIRAGEINKGFTRKNYLMPYLKDRIACLPGVVGCICIQLFYNEDTNDVVAIEINPRYGGGYPLSYYAGANYPKYMIQEYLQNQKIQYSEDWKDNTLFLRYDSEVVVYDEDK